jgi:hypothetical protein
VSPKGADVESPPSPVPDVEAALEPEPRMEEEEEVGSVASSGGGSEEEERIVLADAQAQAILDDGQGSGDEVQVAEADSQTPVSAFVAEELPPQEPELGEEKEAEPAEEDFYVKPSPVGRAEGPPEITPTEQAMASQLFLERGFLPERSVRCAVLQYIQRKMIKAAVDGQYKEADRYWTATQRFIHACHVSDVRDVRGDAMDLIEQQISDAEGDMEKIKGKWDARIAELTQEFAKRLAVAKSEHEKRLAEFDMHWRKPENLRPFSKMSGRLVELRQIEKKTVLAKMYNAARIYQQRANELQEQETRDAQRKARTDILTRRVAIIQNYRDQVTRIVTYRDKLIAALERKRKDEETGMQIRMAHLELQKKRLKERRPGAILPPTLLPDDIDPVVTLRSPRTRARYNAFRKTAKVTHLTIRTYSSFQGFRGGPPLLPPCEEEEEEEAEAEAQ